MDVKGGYRVKVQGLCLMIHGSQIQWEVSRPLFMVDGTFVVVGEPPKS